MEHQHTLTDTDAHFSINVRTRNISSEGKLRLVRGDHNSQTVTFKMPRYVEGHDMLLCNKTEIHYINVSDSYRDGTRETSEDVYPILDLASCGNDMISFSWLISGNGTKYAGELAFFVYFSCLDGTAITYAWNTNLCRDIRVGDSTDVVPAAIYNASDILEGWKKEVLSEVEACLERAEEVEQAARQCADAAAAAVAHANEYIDIANDTAERAAASVDAANEAVSGAKAYSAEANTAMESAKLYANAASGSANVSKQNADAAAASLSSAQQCVSNANSAASNSLQSANNSEASAVSSQGYANAAAASAGTAKNYADETEEDKNATQALKDSAAVSESNAKQSAEAAAAAKNGAQSALEAVNNSASSAKAYADSASSSASSAKGHADNASSSAGSAKAYADGAAASASSASDSATKAASSANAASSHSSDAANYATAAEVSSQSASSYASEAYNSAANASSYANSAYSSESRAATSASNAATSSEEASNSATSAANSAGEAADSAEAASSYASNAANSANAASSSADAAAGSANWASAKATDCETYADAAQSSWVNIAYAINDIFPIGCIYITTTNVSPASFIGGSWELIKDRFLMAAGDTYSAGSTGGYAAVRLYEQHIPSHRHMGLYWTNNPLDLNNGSTNVGYRIEYYSEVGGVRQTDAMHTGYAGGGQTHDNIPPYLAVYGKEYGSARWGTPADIAPFTDEDFFNNIPITKTEHITMSSRPKQPKYARNKNILCIGGSGSGKTRFFVKPSLLQCHSSYVVTDPKGYNNIGQRKSHTVRRKSSAMWLFLYPI